MNMEEVLRLCPEFEYIERTLNRKGPNCFDFHIGKIRDLTTHIHSLLQALAEARQALERLADRTRMVSIVDEGYEGEISARAKYARNALPTPPSGKEV